MVASAPVLVSVITSVVPVSFFVTSAVLVVVAAVRGRAMAGLLGRVAGLRRRLVVRVSALGAEAVSSLEVSAGFRGAGRAIVVPVWALVIAAPLWALVELRALVVAGSGCGNLVGRCSFIFLDLYDSHWFQLTFMNFRCISNDLC